MRALTQAGELIIESHWSPDGRAIAVNSGHSSSIIRLDDKGAVAGLEPIPAPTPETFFYPLAWTADGSTLVGSLCGSRTSRTSHRIYSPGSAAVVKTVPNTESHTRIRRGAVIGNRYLFYSQNDGCSSWISPRETSASWSRARPTAASRASPACGPRPPVTSSARPTTQTSGSAPRPRQPADTGKGADRMALERALKTKDIVLFNVAAIVGMRWVALAAAQRAVLALPLGARRGRLLHPAGARGHGAFLGDSGGRRPLRLDVEAFGQRQGFLAGWLYWSSNITYFPDADTFDRRLRSVHLRHPLCGARAERDVRRRRLARPAGDRARLQHRRAEDRQVGAEHRRPRAVAPVARAAARSDWSRSSPPARRRRCRLRRSSRTSRRCRPSSSSRNLCFGFAGLELAPTMAGEVVEPRKTFPRAISISGLSIAACYMLGTVSILWALPKSEVSILAGVNQAITQAGAAHGLPWLGAPVALLMTLAGLGGIGAWLIGTARLLFCGGLDRYLPPVFASHAPEVEDALRSHWSSRPAFSAIFIIAATQGATVKEAYLKLVNASAHRLLHALYLHVRLRHQAARRDRPPARRRPGARRRRRKRLLERPRLRHDGRRDRPRPHPAGRNTADRRRSSSRSSSVRSASSPPASSSTRSPSAAAGTPKPPPDRGVESGPDSEGPAAITPEDAL